jgi:hypothetical protein
MDTAPGQTFLEKPSARMVTTDFFHFPAERSISQPERQKTPARRLKNQLQNTGIQCLRFDDPYLIT